MILETSEKPLHLMIGFHMLVACKVNILRKYNPSSSLFQQYLPVKAGRNKKKRKISQSQI